MYYFWNLSEGRLELEHLWIFGTLIENFCVFCFSYFLVLIFFYSNTHAHAHTRTRSHTRARTQPNTRTYMHPHAKKAAFCNKKNKFFFLSKEKKLLKWNFIPSRFNVTPLHQLSHIWSHFQDNLSFYLPKDTSLTFDFNDWQLVRQNERTQSSNLQKLKTKHWKYTTQHNTKDKQNIQINRCFLAPKLSQDDRKGSQWATN